MLYNLPDVDHQDSEKIKMLVYKSKTLILTKFMVVAVKHAALAYTGHFCDPIWPVTSSRLQYLFEPSIIEPSGYRPLRQE